MYFKFLLNLSLLFCICLNGNGQSGLELKIKDFNKKVSGIYCLANQFVDMMAKQSDNEGIQQELYSLTTTATNNLKLLNASNFAGLKKNDTLTITDVINNICDINDLTNSPKHNRENLIKRYSKIHTDLTTITDEEKRTILLLYLTLQINHEYARSLESAYKIIGIGTPFKSRTWLITPIEEVELSEKQILHYVSLTINDHIAGLLQNIKEQCEMRGKENEHLALSSLQLTNLKSRDFNTLTSSPELNTEEINQLVDQFYTIAKHLGLKEFDYSKFKTQLHKLQTNPTYPQIKPILISLFISEFNFYYAHKFKGIVGASDIKFTY